MAPLRDIDVVIVEQPVVLSEVIHGTQGIPGPPGADGPEGPQGEQGPQGDQGPQGTQGEQGVQGEQGPQGEVGPQGPEGPVGPEGPQGLQGEQGPVGPEGAVGPAGLNWQGAWDAETDYAADDAVGYDDASWFADVDPPAGEVPSQASAYWHLLAAQGATGPQGQIGPEGPQGPEGPEGPEGPQGPQGEVGPEGPAGTSGSTIHAGDGSPSSAVYREGATGWGRDNLTTNAGLRWYGYEFVPQKDIQVGALRALLGNAISVELAIWRTADAIKLASVEATSQAGIWVEAPITPITLSAGQNYIVAWLGDGAARYGTGVPTFDPDIVFVQTRFATTSVNSNTMPSLVHADHYGYADIMFQPLVEIGAGDVGEDGDYYLDKDAGDLYGPKSSGAFPSPISLIGPQGPAGGGSSGGGLLSGSGAPVDGFVEGDKGAFYLDADNDVLYGPRPVVSTTARPRSGATDGPGAAGWRVAARFRAIEDFSVVAFRHLFPTSGTYDANTVTGFILDVDRNILAQSSDMDYIEGQEIQFEFPEPVSLVDGTEYYVAFSADGNVATNNPSGSLYPDPQISAPVDSEENLKWVSASSDFHDAPSNSYTSNYMAYILVISETPTWDGAPSRLIDSDSAIQTHVDAVDPHGDRAYADSLLGGDSGGGGLLSGSGAPIDGAVEGDGGAFYLDVDNDILYGPRPVDYTTAASGIPRSTASASAYRHAARFQTMSNPVDVAGIQVLFPAYGSSSASQVEFLLLDVDRNILTRTGLIPFSQTVAALHSATFDQPITLAAGTEYFVAARGVHTETAATIGVPGADTPYYPDGVIAAPTASQYRLTWNTGGEDWTVSPTSTGSSQGIGFCFSLILDLSPTWNGAEERLVVKPSDAMIAVTHGADSAFPRPDVGVVYWIGSVEPANAAPSDMWHDTTA